MDHDPVVTSDTVTLRWKEATPVVDTGAASYIWFCILASTDMKTFIPKTCVPFRTTPDQWQEVTVTGLEPDTQYWFDIAVYRIYSDGTIFQNENYTVKDEFGLISASTLHSNIISIQNNNISKRKRLITIISRE